MGAEAKTIAVLVSNPALSSILTMVLASVPALRVRPFETQLALTTYMRLAPVDVIVSDFDNTSARADALARALRMDTRLERRDFQFIALASSVSGDTKALASAAGIDEIILKPMSPKYLLERVLSRLARRAAHAARKTPAAPQWPANVIPLFGRTPQPQA